MEKVVLTVKTSVSSKSHARFQDGNILLILKSCMDILSLDKILLTEI